MLADRIELQNVAAASRCRLLREYRHGRAGATSSCRHRCAHEVGRRPRRPVRSVRHATGWGLNLELQHQVRQERHAPAAGRLRRGHPELHERRAGGRRHRPQSGQPRTPIKAKAIPIAGSSPSSTTAGTASGRPRSATRAPTSTTPRAGAERVQDGHYALVNVLYYPVPNVMMGGEFQWGRRENFDGESNDGFKVQFSFKYNFSQTFGGVVMMTITRVWLAFALGADRRRAGPLALARRRRDPSQAVERRARAVQGTSRKARTPTTSRRSPRSIRTCSASRW